MKGFVELFWGDNAEGFEFFELLEEVAAARGELAFGFGVGILGLAELRAEGGEGVGEGGELFVELGGGGDDFLGLFALGFA